MYVHTASPALAHAVAEDGAELRARFTESIRVGECGLKVNLVAHFEVFLFVCFLQKASLVEKLVNSLLIRFSLERF